MTTPKHPALSDIELRLLRLLADGYNTGTIAEAMHVSPSSIKTYIERVHTKLGALNRTHAVAIAYECGYLSTRRTGAEGLLLALAEQLGVKIAVVPRPEFVETGVLIEAADS